MFYRTFRFAVIALSIAAPLAAPALAQTGRAQSGEKRPAVTADTRQPKAWIGVEVKSLTRADPDYPGRRIAAGAQVIGISERSPAATVLANGDMLLTLDGQSINSAKTFFSALAAKEPGAVVKLGISRGGKKQAVSVTLATRPEDTPAETPAAAADTAPASAPAAEAPAPQQQAAAEPAAPEPAAQTPASAPAGQQAPQTQAAAPFPAAPAPVAQAEASKPQAPAPAPAPTEPQKQTRPVQPPSRAPVYAGACDGVLVAGGIPGKAERYCLKPGGGAAKDQSFRDCPTCPELVVVPSGGFTMGSPQSEAGDREGAHNDREGPQHQVTIPRVFAVGKFAVTFDEWDACVADKGCPDDPKRDSEGWGRGRRPVVNVTWGEAKAYAKWLSKKTGRPYRLLSEAEREYVARAGTSTPYWWGASVTTAQANFSMDQTVNGENRYDGEPDAKFRGQTVPVDEFQPNPWGLHQVHGNIWEWVEDCRHDDYKTKPDALAKNGGAWVVGDCFYRMLRGGGWNNVRFSSRSAARGFEEFDRADSNTGIRVARDIPE